MSLGLSPTKQARSGGTPKRSSASSMPAPEGFGSASPHPTTTVKYDESS